MFAAGPWLAPDAREDGQEAGRQAAFYLLRRCWQGLQSFRKQPEGLGEGQKGEGGLPSHASPQAGSAAKDEFVYSQERRLPASREKGFFIGAWRAG